MAYLTEYSYRQLIERIEIENVDRIDKQFFKTNIYNNDMLFYFFNQFELKKLFKEKLVLSDDKSYVLAYKDVPEREDNLDYIIELRGKVKYHIDNTCDALNSGFKNFFMPEPIVRTASTSPELYRTLVKEIRKWFELNNYTVKRYLEGEINDHILTTNFNRTFPDKYNIEKITISQSDKSQYKWYVEKKTTGNIGTELVFDYKFFLNRITELLLRREELCNGIALKNLSRYDFLNKRTDVEIKEILDEKIMSNILRGVSSSFTKNYGIENLRKFWEMHSKMKIEAFNLLSEYFKWTYNFKEKSFDVVFLKDFNLEECNLCFKRDNRQ